MIAGVGLPLWASGRGADMQWFAFGNQRQAVSHSGTSRAVGDYSLHVQCPWRIVRGDAIVVGSRDLYYPADETAEVPPEFDYDYDGMKTRRDRRVDALLENATTAYIVTDVRVGAAGAFQIHLDEGYALEEFPDDSAEAEDWRFFRPYLNDPHLVVTGAGLE